ncbi:MAG: peptidoglycan-binding domain-containing protein [Pseudomonadota bacterium]
MSIISVISCGTPNPIGDGTVWGNLDSSKEIIEEEGIANNWNRKDLVKSVQEALQELGYDPGNLSGRESAQTNNAVKQYRIDHGLEVSTTIDADLEQHIDDFIWKTRNEKSIDPREVAEVIVYNRQSQYCKDKLGDNFEQISFPQAESDLSDVYIYRIQLDQGGRPPYPDSKIFVNSKFMGIVDHNQHLKISVEPGMITLSEEEGKSLNNPKRGKSFVFEAKPGESYFFQLIVGKYDKVTHSPGSSYEPVVYGGGALDYLVTGLIWSLLSSSQTTSSEELFYYADYLDREPEIGQCHVRLTSESKP